MEQPSAQSATSTTHSTEEIDAVQAGIVARFTQELDAMTNALEQRLPGLSGQLIKINDLLRSYPETVAMLRPEQIGQLMRGVIQESKQQFTIAAVAGRGNAGKDLIKKINSANFDPSKIQF